MGPWLCSHGRFRGWSSLTGCRSGFNGAVALQPRKESPEIETLPQSWLQWGRGFAATEAYDGACVTYAQLRFNGAVALQPRKLPTVRRNTIVWASFNGAVALQPRKGGVGSRFVPRAQSDICEYPGAHWTSSKPFHHHGLRKPFPASQLAPRERSPGF